MAFDRRANLRLALVEGDTSKPLEMVKDLVDYAWMPDSETLLVATGKPMGLSTFRVIDLSGREIRSVVPTLEIVLAQTGMSVSPGGRFAVVSALATDDLNEQDLYRVNLMSGKTTRLTTSVDIIETFPTVRDSRDIVFTATTTDRTRSVVVSWRDDRRRVLSQPEMWVDRATVSASGVIMSGFPAESRLAWRAYLVNSEAVEIDGTNGMRWITSPPDGSEVAGTVAEGIGSGGQVVIVSTPG
jgi:hypothetical protein